MSKVNTLLLAVTKLAGDSQGIPVKPNGPFDLAKGAIDTPQITEPYSFIPVIAGFPSDG